MVTFFVASATGLSAKATVIGGFDSSRGGSFSLATGTFEAQARTDLASSFPSYTISSSPTLTPSYLATVNDVFIASPNTGSSTSNALSSSEQSALLNYVLAGGGAIIAVDNNTFAGAGTDAVNQSFISPFGLHVTGTLSGSQNATITNLTNPVINGPFGVVSTFETNFPGFFDSLGTNAAGLAQFTSNETAIAVITPGILGAHSGAVVLLSDSDTFDAGDSNDVLFENAVAYTVPVALTWNNTGGTGDGIHWDIDNNQNWNNGTAVTAYSDGSTVTFNDFNAGNYAVTLNIPVNPASVTVNSSGNYTISGIGGIGGTGSLKKSGSGTLTLSTVNTYSGGTNVTGGKLIVGTHGALPSNQAVTLAGGNMQLAPHTGGETVSSLSITGGSTLDLTNNHIVIDYGVPADQATVDSAIRSYISSGEIFSSEANGSYGVGYADGNDASESGIVAPNSVLVAYALYGDANLDGVVNGSDFTILASHLGKSVTGWDQGDFFYTGTVTGADFTALVSNLGKSASGADIQLPAADYAAIDAFAAANGLMADVPEPVTGSMLLIAGVGILMHRRRKQLA
jgi:autotransporter-associated beta strand protein